jgi:hypothetical protein
MLSPQATALPSLRRATVCALPAATATNDSACNLLSVTI